VSGAEGRSESSEATGGSGPAGRSEATAGSGQRMVIDVVVYTLARLLLAAVLTGVIFFLAHLIGIAEFPLVVALLFAIVLALPLGIWVFAPLRRRATASIAEFDERRRTDRDQLRARLRGDESAPE
jgi:hypothetical protein